MQKNLKKASGLFRALASRNFHTNRPINKEVQIFINDQPHVVDSSSTIFQACAEAGVTIPRFCFHERLSVAGNCRMCLVEVEKAPKPIASCATMVLPNMKVYTDSLVTRNARGGVMEFLLANHPLDCPICDQGGECDLQNQSQLYGYQMGRFNEYKRGVENKEVGPLIRTIMTRCIHCTRCVRFAQEVAGIDELGLAGRGHHTEIGTYVEKLFTSELSANIVDLCPVGALTNGPYAFTARPWELTPIYSVDCMDSLGANIQIDIRGTEVMRVLPRVNEEVNEEWVTDKGRHSFDGLKRQRLTTPLQRQEDGSFKELDWMEAVAEVSKAMKKVKGEEMAGIIGRFADVESIVALRDLMHRSGCENLELRSDAPKLEADFRAQYLMNSRITGVEEADLLLLVGTNPKYENAVFNSRIRKAVANNDLEVALIGSHHELTYEYEHLGTTTKTLQQIADGLHPYCAKLANAQLPMIIVGGATLERKDGEAILNALYQITSNTKVYNEEEGWNGFNILHKEISRVGALDVGISTYNKDLSKKPKFVFLLGADDIRVDDIPDDAFVVYLGHQGDEGAYYADIILPGSAYTEKAGTYVNTEGRVVQGRKAVSAPGLAKDDWAILRALSEELGTPLPYDDISQLRYRLAELAPHLAKYDWVESSGYGNLALQPKKDAGKMNETALTDDIDNYYMTDSISRSSPLMAKCSKTFNKHKFTNFKKAPEYLK